MAGPKISQSLLQPNWGVYPSSEAPIVCQSQAIPRPAKLSPPNTSSKRSLGSTSYNQISVSLADLFSRCCRLRERIKDLARRRLPFGTGVLVVVQQCPFFRRDGCDSGTALPSQDKHDVDALSSEGHQDTCARLRNSALIPAHHGALNRSGVGELLLRQAKPLPLRAQALPILSTKRHEIPLTTSTLVPILKPYCNDDKS